MTSQSNRSALSQTLDLRDQLTVVIPTYNRRRLLARALSYWAALPVQVIVMDGSPDPLPDSDLQGISGRTIYVHDPSTILQRLGRAGDMVSTPFVTMIGDDEFHLLSGLAASVSALQADPRLVACMGRALGFSKTEDNVLSGRQVYPGFADHAVIEVTPVKRMISHFSNYAPTTIYGVLRTPIWRHGFSAALEREFPVFASAEIQFELAVAAQGMSRVLPVLHWLRSFETEPIRNTGEVTLTTKTRFHQWWADSTQESEHQAYVNLLARHVAIATNAPEPQIADGVRAALDGYVSYVADRPAKRREQLRQMAIKDVDDSVPPTLPQQMQDDPRIAPFLQELMKLAYNAVTFDPDEIHQISRIILGASPE